MWHLTHGSKRLQLCTPTAQSDPVRSLGTQGNLHTCWMAQQRDNSHSVMTGIKQSSKDIISTFCFYLSDDCPQSCVHPGLCTCMSYCQPQDACGQPSILSLTVSYILHTEIAKAGYILHTEIANAGWIVRFNHHATSWKFCFILFLKKVLCWHFWGTKKSLYLARFFFSSV